MWVYLDSWMVQDGEIPELSVGDTLRGVALRAACLSLQEAGADVREGIVQRPDPDPSNARTSYHLTGTVESCGRNEVLLAVAGLHYLAEPADVRAVPGTSPGESMLERYSPDFVVPPVGARAAAVCTWEVLAEYETGSQELRADWRVHGLAIEHRDATAVELREARILRVDTVDRLHRWADERVGERIIYLLDLQVSGSGAPVETAPIG